MRPIGIVPAVIAGALLLAACGGENGAGDAVDDGGGGNAGAGATIQLTAVDNEFETPELEVAAGQSIEVEFTNGGNNPHTFTSEDLDFDTGIVEPGDTVTVTFEAPDGPTGFVCTIHEESDDMVGEIIPSD